MTTDYPPDIAPATAQYVLDVIRAWHRIAVAAKEATPLELTFETPVAEWEDSLGIDDWGRSGLGGSMNEAWSLDIPVSEWHAMQTSEPTLGDVCRLIESRATRPVIRPWKHIAGDCLPAGAFLTVRAMLVESGADPSHVKPSTPLFPYLTRGLDEFWDRITRLTPGCGPVLRLTRPERLISGGLVFLILLALPIGFLIGSCLAVAIGLTLFLLGLFAHGMASAMLGTWHFLGHDMRTFRDLSYRLAGQEPRRRIQTTS